MERLSKLVLHVYCLCNHNCNNGKCHHEYHNLFTFFQLILIDRLSFFKTMQRYGFCAVCANIRTRNIIEAPLFLTHIKNSEENPLPPNRPLEEKGVTIRR